MPESSTESAQPPHSWENIATELSIHPELARHIEEAFTLGIATHIDPVRAKSFTLGIDSISPQDLDASLRQPIDPVSTIAEILGINHDEDGQPRQWVNPEIIDGLRQAHRDNAQAFRDMGLDPTLALTTGDRIKSFTEAYIARYSKILGGLADFVAYFTRGKTTAPKIWINDLWVPEEKQHDEIIRITDLANPDPAARLDTFYAELRRHARRELKVDTSSIFKALCYLAQQERLTDINYDHTAAFKGPILGKIERRIGQDEARHTRFYRSALRYLLQFYPDEVICALRDVNNEFEMPGSEGIDDFDTKAQNIALVGILDAEGLAATHYELVSYLGLFETDSKTGESLPKLKTDEGKKALAEIHSKYTKAIVGKRERQMEKIRARRLNNNSLILPPAILGVNFIVDPRTLKRTRIGNSD